jgi:putative transposase
VLVSLCYVLLRWLLEFVALRARSKEFQELEIIVLRHELAILRRTTRRPAITAVDRVCMANSKIPEHSSSVSRTW